MIDKSFLQGIVELSTLADKVQIVHPDPEPSHRYMVRQPDGQLTWYNAEPKCRQHEANNLETVVSFASSESAIWYGRSAVIALLDDKDRRDRCTFRLQSSLPLLKLRDLEKNKPSIPHREFCVMLRTVLKDCLSTAGKFQAIVEKVRWGQTAGGTADAAHGTRSLGKALEEKIEGSDQFPQEVTLWVPIWENYIGPCANVRCAFEPDPSTQTFQLFPLPGQLEAAIQAGEKMIFGKLSELLKSTCPIYYGVP